MNLLAKFIAERRSIAEAATPKPFYNANMESPEFNQDRKRKHDMKHLMVAMEANDDARNCMPTLLQIVEMQDAALDMAMEYCEDRIVWDDLNEARAAVEALLKEKP